MSRVSAGGAVWQLGALASVAFLAACVPAFAGGPARAPRTTVPRDFGVGAADTVNTGRVEWRTFFGDPHLTALIDVALENNQELNIAIQETLVLNNEIMARTGEYMPSLGLGVGAGLEHVGRYTSQGQADERNGVPAHLQDYSVGLYASWEVDIWGRLHDAAGAARLRYLASLEGQNFIVTRLVAEIASRYYELIALDRQLEIVRSNLQLQERSLEVVRVEQQATRVTMLAVHRFEAQLLDFRSRQFELAQRIVETENEINFLVGRFPQHVERSPTTALSVEPTVLHGGLPTELLENRPDVRRAELELRAAQLDVSAARGRFYPSLRLDGGVGYQSFDITRLVNTPDSILYGILAGITAPLLNRNGITAEYFSANSRQMQAVVGYERTILRAYLDVNTGMNMLGNLSQIYELKTQQVQQLSEAVDVSTVLFNSTRADYLEVLTTQRDFLDAQMELVETRRRQLTATVTVYQALGGGWSRRRPPTSGTAGAATGDTQ